MKMVKKILLGTLALAAVLTFASCKMESGEGETDGNKWDLTMTVDATEDAKTPLAEGKVYRRFWKQFSSSEKVAEITTTITIDMNEGVYNEGAASVVGLIFDLNKNADNTDLVDFNLIGINPKTKAFYVERYTGIEKQSKEELDATSEENALTSKLSTPVAAKDLSTTFTGKVAYGTFGYKLTDNMWNVKDDVATIVAKIEQSDKKYSVYLGSVKVAEYSALSTAKTDTIDDVEYAVGGIACYGNAGKGNKVVANYVTEKDSVTGKLEAEEIEE